MRPRAGDGEVWVRNTPWQLLWHPHCLKSFKATQETSSEDWNKKMAPQLSLTRHLVPGLWENGAFHQAMKKWEQLASLPPTVVNEGTTRQWAQRSEALSSSRELCFGRCQTKQLENCGWEYSWEWSELYTTSQAPRRVLVPLKKYTS